MNSNQKARFYGRKYLTLLLPVVIPLLILGLVSMTVTGNLINQEMTELTRKQLDVLKYDLEQTIVEMDSLNLAFASNNSVVSVVDDVLSREDTISFEDIRQVRILQNFLNAQINGKPYVDSFYLYLEAYPDRFFDSARGIVEIEDFTDKGWRDSYLARGQGELLWTENRNIYRYDFETTPRPCITFYRRIFPALNKRDGVLVLNLDRTYFDSLLEDSRLYREQSIFLLDRFGDIILSTGDNGKIPLGENRNGPASPEGDFSLTGERGNRYFRYVSPVDYYGWKIVSLIPEKSLTYVYDTIRNLIIVLLALSLFLGLLLTLSLMRRNSKRVAAVTALFEQAEKGNIPIIPPKERHDEYDYMIQTLIRTFLNERYAKLQLSERRTREENLELKTLRAQINPHFLFNTLESLYWMVYGEEGLPSPASIMIKDLSSLLRYSMENGERVTLAEEIDHGKSYLAIQQVRYRDKIRVFWHVDGQTMKIPVVKLLLQPLLENAIYHGVRNLPGGGEIHVRTELTGEGDLKVQVRDNGKGMGDADRAKLISVLSRDVPPDNHIGLYNTHRRLMLNYGSPYGLNFPLCREGGFAVYALLPGVIVE